MPRLLSLLLLALPLTAAAACWEARTIPAGSLTNAGQLYRWHTPYHLLVYRPARPSGRLLVLLHGWNQRAESWRERTRAAALAEQYGVILVAPQTGTCNYMMQFYPETHPRMRWLPVPDVVWLERVFLPWLRTTFGTQTLAVAGVSTGARGALVTAQQLSAFRSVGYISGDWDIIKDNGTLYKMSLGPQERFRARWEANDTSRKADRLKDRRVFIAHAADDRVTPAWQTEQMHRDLTRLGTVCRFRIAPRGGHEWAYWDSCLPELFAFFFDNT